MKKLQLEDDHYCFACGKENPAGLRLEWKIEDLTASAQFIPERHHQGWKGIVHGGIIATLLDESMVRLACVLYGTAVTAEMTVRFLAPALVGEVLLIRSEILTTRRKLIEMKATVQSAGALIAHSTGKAIKVSETNPNS